MYMSTPIGKYVQLLSATIKPSQVDNFIRSRPFYVLLNTPLQRIIFLYVRGGGRYVPTRSIHQAYCQLNISRQNVNSSSFQQANHGQHLSIFSPSLPCKFFLCSFILFFFRRLPCAEIPFLHSRKKFDIF